MNAAAMTQDSKKRSKKKPWFKKGDRVVWEVSGPPWHGTVREVFQKIGSKLYTHVWVNWDRSPGSRDLIYIEWLRPESPLETLALTMPYEVGNKVKLIKTTTVRNVGPNGETHKAPAGTVGTIISTNRRKAKQKAYAVSFPFLPDDRCLILFRHEMAPAE